MDCFGDSKMLKMAEPWGTCQVKLLVWNQPRGEKYVTINKAKENWESEEPFEIRHGAYRIWSLFF